MRVFVWEYLSSGACAGEPLPDSLLREGAAMLYALLDDVSRIPHCTAVSLYDARLEPPDLPRVEFVSIADRRSERTHFQRFAQECDRVLIIAPEFEDILAQRRECIDATGGRAVGCTPQALRLCADKLQLAQFLSQRGIATPETKPFHRDDNSSAIKFPCIIKPRDGAGSQHTYGVRSHDELARLPLPAAGWPQEFVRQPYIVGYALSTSAIVGPRGTHVFPVGGQHLTDDGRFNYRGGEIPARLPTIAAAAAVQESIEQLVRRAAAQIPGLNGYVGFDIVLPREAPAEPVLIEINPRLTTSYVGYRKLTDDNLAERILFPERHESDIRWRTGFVTFTSSGTVDSHQELPHDQP